MSLIQFFLRRLKYLNRKLKKKKTKFELIIQNLNKIAAALEKDETPREFEYLAEGQNSTFGQKLYQLSLYDETKHGGWSEF